MSRPFPGPRVVAGLCLALLIAFVASACSAGPEPAPRTVPAPAETPAASLTASTARTEARLGQVHGRLPQKRRRAVRRQVADVVVGWWEAAYLGGTYPRKSFPAAFPGFTKGAEARARGDKRVMSNLGIGARVDSVEPLRRGITLDVVAVGGRPRSVTARFVLRFRTTGDRAGVTVVRGRLFLTRGRSGWRVFGYDVSRGVRA